MWKHSATPAYTMPGAPRRTVLTVTGGQATGLAYNVDVWPEKHVPAAFISKTNRNLLPNNLNRNKDLEGGRHLNPALPKPPSPSIIMSRSYGRDLPIMHLDPVPRYVSPMKTTEAPPTAVAPPLPEVATPTKSPRAARSPSPRWETIHGTPLFGRMSGRKDQRMFDTREALHPERAPSQKRAPAPDFQHSLGRNGRIQWFAPPEEFPTRYEPVPHSRIVRGHVPAPALGRMTGRNAPVIHDAWGTKTLTKDLEYDVNPAATSPSSRGVSLGLPYNTSNEVGDILTFCSAQINRLHVAMAKTAPAPRKASEM